jgi:hypothetical protein
MSGIGTVRSGGGAHPYVLSCQGGEMSKNQFIIPPLSDPTVNGLYNRLAEEHADYQLIRKIATMLRDHGIAIDDTVSVSSSLAVILNGYSGGSSLYPVDDRGRALHTDPYVYHICREVYGVD